MQLNFQKIKALKREKDAEAVKNGVNERQKDLTKDGLILENLKLLKSNKMNKEHEIEFIKELKESGIKSKDHKRLIHLFAIIEDVAFENNTDAKQIIAMYNLAKTALARG